MPGFDDSITAAPTPAGRRPDVEVHGAALSVAALGAAAAYGLFWLWRLKVLNGDEPPIRVRNGSLELSILGLARWEVVSHKKWMISTGTRNRDVLEIDIWSNTGSSCGEQTTGRGDPLVITYADGSTSQDVTVRVKNKRTVVTSDLDFKISKDGTVLRYRSATGYVQKIAIGTTSCTYSDKEQFDSMTILDVRP